MMAVVTSRMYVQIYGFEIKLVLTDNLLEYVQEEVPDVPDHLREIVYQDNMAIVFDYKRSKEREFDFLAVFSSQHLNGRTLNHETFHLTARIMRYIGASLVPESEECYCYLSDYIFNGLEKKTKHMREELIKLIREEEEHGNPDRGEKVQSST